MIKTYQNKTRMLEKRIVKDKEHWLNQKMKARPLGHSVMNAVWSEPLNAMIFTDTVTPSTRMQKEKI